MPCEAVVNEISAAQCIPSDYSDQSLIRERDSRRPWETDLPQTRNFEFIGEHGYATRGMDFSKLGYRSASLFKRSQ